MLRGIGLKLASVALFACMAAIIKFACKEYPVGEVVFFRSFFALPALIGWLMWLHALPGALHTSRPLGHLGRGVISALGMVSGFSALSLLPLPDATAFGFATPLFVVVFAAVVLSEPVRLYRWSAVAIGFAGVVVMLSDHLSLTGTTNRAETTGAAIALCGAVFSASATIQTRRLTQTEGTGAIVFYLTAFTTVLGLSSLFLADMRVYGVGTEPIFTIQRWVAPTLSEAALLVAMGTLGGVGQIMMTQSYRYADASVLAAFDYTSILWAMLIGFLVFNDRPTAAVLGGATIVIAAGIFVVWRESRLGIKRAEQAVASRTRAI